MRKIILTLILVALSTGAQAQTNRLAGSALRFTGTTSPSYVSLNADAAHPPVALTGTAYTQTAWIKPTLPANTVTYYLFGTGTPATNTAAPYIAISGSGRMQAGFGTGTAVRANITPTGTITSGVWSQVAVTYNGTNLLLYVNGTVVATGTYSDALSGTAVAYVGNVLTTGSAFFPGDIDEITQWNRALSQTEIRQLRHRTPKGTESGLVSYLHFNESGTTSTDAITGTVGTHTGTGLSRVSSTAPVSYGTSSLVSITGTGSVSFTGTNSTINFTTPGTTPYDVVVSRLDGQPRGTQPTATGLAQLYSGAYWIVDRYSTTTFAADITYTLKGNSLSAADAATPSKLKLFQRDNNGESTFDSPVSATSANATTGTMTFPITALNQTVLGTFGTSPLPVTLTRFTAEHQGENGLLRWATAQELTNDYFEVESSADGREFRPVGRVAGAGSSSAPHSYQLLDRNLSRYARPLVYYRLRQVDQDGTTAFSPVQALATGPGQSGSRLQLLPNPAHDAVQVLDAAGPVELLDVTGRVVRQYPAGTGVSVAGLPTGVYILRGGTRTSRLVVE